MTELTIWAIDDECLVERFAVAMAERLRWNAKYRNKSGWQDMTPKQLLRRAEQELGELRRAVESNADALVVAHEAADVGNFCAMLATVYESDARSQLSSASPVRDPAPPDLLIAAHRLRAAVLDAEVLRVAIWNRNADDVLAADEDEIVAAVRDVENAVCGVRDPSPPEPSAEAVEAVIEIMDDATDGIALDRESPRYRILKDVATKYLLAAYAVDFVVRGAGVPDGDADLRAAPLVDLADEYIRGAHPDSTVAQRPAVLRDFVKWVLARGAGVVPPEPHSNAIGDDDIEELLNRLGLADVDASEIARVRDWLKEQDDKVAL